MLNISLHCSVCTCTDKVCFVNNFLVYLRPIQTTVKEETFHAFAFHFDTAYFEHTLSKFISTKKKQLKGGGGTCTLKL